MAAAWAFWSAPGAGNGSAVSGSLAAATINATAASPTTITVSWTQQASLEPTSPANSAIVYSVERKLGAGSWAALTVGGCSGAKPHGVTSCIDAPSQSGAYSYRVVASYHTWTVTSAQAGPVTVDLTPPTISAQLTPAPNAAGWNNTSPVAVALSADDGGGSGVESIRYTTDGSDPKTSGSAQVYTAPLSIAATATVRYFATDFAGNASAVSAQLVKIDTVAPSGGTVDATGLGGTDGRYATSTTLSIAFSPGTDSGSGLATGATLLRATASLGDGSCGTYGTYAQVGVSDPVSPASNTVPIDHACYRYRYTVLDQAGNQATYTSPDVKVDTAAPHPDFLQPITSPETVRPGPAHLATGDIDNDGDPDIVTTAVFDVATSVLVNNGVGSFRETTVGSNGATLDVGLGKFDNDTYLDLVLLYQQTPPATGLLIIFKGGGDGSFTYLGAANTIVNTGVRPTALAVGDFNGDTIDDVAVVNSQNDIATEIGTVMTYLGNPAGTDSFAAATPAQTLSAQVGVVDIAYADFNGGAKDLVVTNAESSSISFLAGNGAGFNAPSHIPAGAPVTFMDTAQLNPGTNRDVVASVRDSSPSAVRTLLGDGAGGFPAQATKVAGTTATGVNPQGVVANDLDGDGDADIAIANGSPSTVSVLANDGTGAFTDAPASPETGVGAGGTLPYGIVSADFDGSGYNDLAVSPVFTSPGQMRILLNQSGNRANLSVAKTDAPDPVPGGQNLTYTLTVTNAGPSTPSSVKTTDRLPAGVTFNAAASSPSCSAAGTTTVTVTCSYGAVAAGSPESLQIVVTTSAATPPSLTNTATVAGNLADPTPADNTSTTTTTVTDATAPTISRAVVAKTDGSSPGTIRQGGDYYAYAEVTDNRGVSTVTANTSSFDTGVTSASLSSTGGPWTVGGVSYSYRSATLTANTGLTTGAGYSYAISAADAAGNSAGPTSYSATIETYDNVITGTAGLVSYWRFNDGVTAGDEFTETTGAVLSTRAGAVGASWTSVASQARTAVITAAGRLRKETGNGAAQYYASGVPPSADYLVEGEVRGASGLATDALGVVGRQDVSGTGQTYYAARYMVDTGRWELAKFVSGTSTLIGTGTGTGYYTQNISVGVSYRVGLRMNGTSISLLVDGVTRITATDSSISAAGRGGVRLGTSTSTAQVTDSAGMHLDNFRITGLGTTAADSRGANNGVFTNGPVLNEPGPLAGSGDRAARLDGVNDYVTVPDATSLDLGDGPLSLEAWVKRTTASSAGISIFQKGASAMQFGLYLDNTFLAKDNIATVVSSTTTVTGTGWHHIVATKSGASAKLYIDGVDRTGTVTNQTLVDTTAALILGAKNGTSEFLAATIDEFAVYNSVLGLPTVLDHYRAGTGTG
jgi:uncharacterized repeat protein (TIGR01451 family)